MKTLHLGKMTPIFCLFGLGPVIRVKFYNSWGQILKLSWSNGQHFDHGHSQNPNFPCKNGKP